MENDFFEKLTTEKQVHRILDWTLQRTGKDIFTLSEMPVEEIMFDLYYYESNKSLKLNLCSYILGKIGICYPEDVLNAMEKEIKLRADEFLEQLKNDPVIKLFYPQLNGITSDEEIKERIKKDYKENRR